MPLELQAKLLRVTETKQLMRLGSSKNIRVDVRIIAATNANIDDMIAQKLFRADLYYRLSTMKLYLMPLRERRDDIVPLAEHFIRSISRRIDKPNIMRFSESAKELLQQMDWFGNVRELQNLVECVVQLYPGDIILPEYILDNVSERYYPKNEQKISAPSWRSVKHFPWRGLPPPPPNLPPPLHLPRSLRLLPMPLRKRKQRYRFWRLAVPSLPYAGNARPLRKKIYMRPLPPAATIVQRPASTWEYPGGPFTGN